jgi:hypothetical protein
MAGTMKKAGHTVESFKSEKGDRTPIESTSSSEGLRSSRPAPAAATFTRNGSVGRHAQL